MNAETINRIEMTKTKLKDSFDVFVIDSLSQCYNEIFLHEYLINFLSLEIPKITVKNTVLIYIKIDDISNINIKYSSEKGDETIANLGFLLKQIINENDLLFKMNGPGFILLVHDYKEKNIKNYTDLIQNEVKKSEIFIDTITVSCALVSVDEIDKNIDIIEKVEYIFDLGQKRINLAHKLGNNSFIDRETVIKNESEGRILIVESDELTQNMLKSFLLKNRISVKIANDGVEAVEIAKKVKFDVIIADRYTKKIDGLTIKRYLNESTINMNTLYILTSQSKNIEIINKTNHLRIDFVLKKPIIIEEVLGIVTRHIEKMESVNI